MISQYNSEPKNTICHKQWNYPYRSCNVNEALYWQVGNEFIRGVSGGERKRTNIGMELIISPPVLFLDEPTTGLDANTANSIMLLLKR